MYIYMYIMGSGNLLWTKPLLLRPYVNGNGGGWCMCVVSPTHIANTSHLIINHAKMLHTPYLLVCAKKTTIL